LQNAQGGNAGVTAGEVIVGVNGVDIKGMKQAEVVKLLSSNR
jgi:C-terminal processing protease CtpA/Prc